MQVARKSRGKIDKPKPKKEASAYIFLIYLQRTKKLKRALRFNHFKEREKKLYLTSGGK